MPTPEVSGPLAKYWQKRDFAQTAEPRGVHVATADNRSFVVQKHAASRLHYDFRLELGGVLVSWAVPKGPSFDPADKRIAVHVEDHPLSYGSFEGSIPAKQYGAGSVIVWDNGNWEPIGDPAEGLAKGKLLFKLHGQKLAGLWELVRIAKPGDKQELWILFKKRGDAFARPRAAYDVVTALPDSVIAKPLAVPASSSYGPPQPASAPKGSATSVSGRSQTSRASSAVPGAIKAPLPEKMSPQLATLATGVPAVGQWIYEIKFDGYRLMCRISDGKASLITRGGHDWSAKMLGLVAELQGLGLKSAWLDGEIVVFGDDGLPSFNALQKSFDRPTVSAGIDYFVFDLPYFEGYDLRAVELIERRRLLKAFLEEKGSEHVRFSADFPGDAASVLQSAVKLGLEGVMAKRSDAPYSSTRSEAWLKLKSKLRQEFVVCGYTDRSDGSPQIGSLLLGLYDDAGELVSVGSVGTGWNAEEAAQLKKKLAKLEIAKAPFPAGAAKPGRWSRRPAGSERWVKPRVVAEVEYREMTPDGQIRHASYVALRSDKPAKAIRRETARTPAGGLPVMSSAAATRVTHGERVIDASTGLTKLDLVRYYESVADFILPHLKGRPCSLVRGPTGVDGSLFFQKHSERTAIPGLKDMDPALWPGHDALLEVDTVQALAGAAQMNAIEFHTWNSTDKNINAPDRMIFDLDPGEGTAWGHVQEAATLVRGLLQELGLEAWLKTSGGKGLHVVVPLTPKLDYDAVKDFSQAIVQHLARVIPARFVARSGPSNRVGKLFVDYLRNGHGATTAAAFSARARAGLGVSMPVAWDALSKLKGGAHWNIATAREHLSFQKSDPWAGYWKKKQTLNAAMKTLGFRPAASRRGGR
ncbi:MAG: DNA ligase D [Methylibium sp.]|uniref:DNA ligase D n=1 Tax=Methylibium sp. TaxID=2067992 RepID=UPI00182B860A|nr:DNA ligase D [Methylibium sp.]MBA3599332.1 DNA ligase D [Methylibium sp.]